MDPAHAHLASAPPHAGGYGPLVRARRVALGLTLADLGVRIGYSPSAISRLERGKRRLTDVELLATLARELRIPPALLGLADSPPTQPTSPTGSPLRSSVTRESPGEDDPVRRRHMLASLAGLAGTTIAAQLEDAILSPAGGEPPSLRVLERDLATAQHAYTECRYGQLGIQLPPLIRAAESARAAGGPRVAAVLADIYGLATNLAVKLADAGLARVTADRALRAARESDDPLASAVAARAVCLAMRHHGRSADAQRLIIAAADQLGGSAGGLVHRGAMLGTAAYTAAVAGHRDDAHELLSAASAAARSIGEERIHRGVEWGPTQANLFAVSVHQALGDAGTAVELSRQVRRERPRLSTERQVRLLTDTVRAYQQTGQAEQTLRTLQLMARLAPEDAARPSNQRVARALLSTAPGRLQSDARRLVSQLKV